MLNFKKIEKAKEDKLIDKLHIYYLKRLTDYYGVKAEQLTRFSWSDNKKVRIYAVEIYLDFAMRHKGILVFATPANKNEILFTSAYTQTKNPNFSELANDYGRLNWLINSNLISPKLAKKIISASVFLTFGLFDLHDMTIESWMNSWIKSEYTETLEIESKPTPITEVSLSNQKYFVDRYHFNDMLKTMNDDQFTDEFNQCLWAYENQKWFLCASGLGSSFEHLLLIILQNYSKRGFNTLQGLGFDPSAGRCIAKFREDPINISSRQERYLRLISSARNAIDHYNSGYTSKELCDVMLTGISSVFNDYYKDSIDNSNI